LAEGWRYILTELGGDGTELDITGNLNLKGAELTKVLSGPHQITGQISLPDASLITADGHQIKRWKTALYAEDPNEELWVGGLVADYTIDGPAVHLDVTGFTAYPKDMPFDGEIDAVAVDPLDLVRQLWDHVQGRQGGNLGVQVDPQTSSIRVGTTPTTTSVSTADDGTVTTTTTQVNVDGSTTTTTITTRTDGTSTTSTSTQAPSTSVQLSATGGPILINWWSTSDIAGTIDSLAKEAPFDYRELHYWDGDRITHYLELGVPELGARRDTLRFVLGENVFKMPTEEYPDSDIVTEVWVYGAGEGRARIRGVASVAPQNSLRRVITIDDKGITDLDAANRRARDELNRYQPEIPGAGITELVIRNHPNAPLGSYDVGDEILYSGDHDWGPVDVWVKITKLTLRPDDGDDVTATVVRAGTLG
jgi:hypothetical protein